MEGFRGYVLTVSLAAFLGALVLNLAPCEKGQKRILQMICGLFLLLVVCSPLPSLKDPASFHFSQDFRKGAESIETQAKAQVHQEMEQDIRTELQAYIEDKALAFGAQVKAEIRLSSELTPWEAFLRGEAAPFARNKLTELIEKELGIPKERQVWIE